MQRVPSFNREHHLRLHALGRFDGLLLAHICKSKIREADLQSLCGLSQSTQTAISIRSIHVSLNSLNCLLYSRNNLRTVTRLSVSDSGTTSGTKNAHMFPQIPVMSGHVGNV